VKFTEQKTIKSLHLCDFGMAKIYGENSFSAHTINGIGTPLYMPPEIAIQISNTSYDPFKADVFSFGIVLLEILFGNVDRSYTDIEKGTIPKIQRDIKQTYPKVVELVKKCTLKDPIQRPTADKLLEEVKTMDFEIKKA